MMRSKCTLSQLFFSILLWALCFKSCLSDCHFPKKKFPNGEFLYQDIHHVNLTVAPENYLLQFRCSYGYLMKGSKNILCSGGQWTDQVPVCIKMRCSEPASIPNGSYVIDSGVSALLTIGSTATYKCDVGYELQNVSHSTLTCHLYTNLNKVQWKGELPSCQKKETCPNPSVSPDGSRQGECCFTGNILHYSCNEDYQLVGADKIECLSGGNWSSPRPLCKPTEDHCESPPTIPNGVAIGEKEGDFYRVDDEVEVMCKPGFRYSGISPYVMCEDTGWEAEFEECVEAFCDVPDPLLNGTIPEIESTNDTVFPFNFEVTYICNEGFRLIGDSWRFCDTKGWSGRNPYCEVIRCPDPGVPEHGTRLGGSFDVGDKVTYKCFTGYEIIGSFERYCMPNGQWSGELTRCDDPKNYCPDPGIPVNGIKSSSNYDMGEIVQFHCRPGYSLLGSDSRECLANRTWSGEDAICAGPYDFDDPLKISEILKLTVTEKEAEQKQKLLEYHQALSSSFRSYSSPRARIIDINFPGRLIFYFAFDVSGSVREHNFRKSVEFAKAIVKRVGISQNGARAGALTFSSQAKLQFLPLDYTTTEQVVGALNGLNYTGGGTSANSALTMIREELIPLTQAVLSKKGQKSIIFILTDGKANMGGDPQDAAELLKLAGVEIYCIGITNTVVQDSLYKIASKPKEQHVFILQNYATMSFLIEEITNGTIDYSQCGLGLEKLGKQASRGRIVGGRQAPEPWPWMAALYFRTPGKSELQCGGSVINENFILTAAHCLYTKKKVIRDVKEVTVKLGLLDVKNKTSMQEFGVKGFYIHPNYKDSAIYDYDIALIHLKRPVEYNAMIRPICLPPINLAPHTTLYKPGEFAVATGWGHTGILQKMQVVETTSVESLKEVILPIQTRDVCRRSVLDHDLSEKVFTERMFCVGDGNGGNDTCTGDSGGPLMQSQLNKDGYTFWTQVGIVSWGIGCGLPNTYGYYTHVQKFHGWLESIIHPPTNFTVQPIGAT